MKANHASAFSQREGLSIYMYILLYQRSFTLPSSRFFLRATLIGLSLFALIYGLHVTVTREIFPSWDDTTVTLSCVTLALLFTVYRAALWQLPLFLFALSAVGIRFLADLITPARAFYHCLAFSAASWGLLAYLSPSSHTAWRKTYYLLGGFLITLPALVAWSYYFLTGSFPQSETLLAIMQTNAGEARGYLATHISLPLLLFPPLYLTALYLISQKSSQGATFTCPPLFARLVLLAVVPAGLILSTHNPVTAPWIGIQDYRKAYADFAEQSKQRTHRLTNLETASAPGLYVLAIGESENSEHMNVYGYPRPTTPWLSSRRNDPHFLFFDDAYSCYVQTVPALSYALTAKNQYNDMSLADAPSLIETAKAAGFHTVWISNQVRFSAWDTPTTIIASEADEQYWRNSHLGATADLDVYDDALAEELTRIKSSERTLVILHYMGSHMPYAYHHPKSYEKIHSDDPYRDQYDDTILFHDYVMEKLYEALAARPDFQTLLYFSDHGEAIDLHLDHNPTIYVPEMTYIPFYMAFSDTYLSSHPKLIGNLAARQKSRWTNDLVFDTQLALMGIRLPDLYEPENDITSDHYDDTPDRFKTLFGTRAITAK